MSPFEGQNWEGEEEKQLELFL